MKKLGVVLGIALTLGLTSCFDSETEILKQIVSTLLLILYLLIIILRG